MLACFVGAGTGAQQQLLLIGIHLHALCLPWASNTRFPTHNPPPPRMHRSYLILFLKFIASVVPTIEYDYTMPAGGN